MAMESSDDLRSERAADQFASAPHLPIAPTPTDQLHVSYPKAPVPNWGRLVHANPKAVVRASSPGDVAAVLTNHEDFPGPIRPVGSNHSTTRVAVTDGTMINMRALDDIEIDRDRKTVTVGAGALFIDVAEKLQAQGLEMPMNPEIGNITMGSAATCATKDSAMPDGNGGFKPAQYSSYCTAMKVVTPGGKLISINEKDHPEAMRMMRSSYGLLGVVVEATFQVEPLQPMLVRHKVYSLDDFEGAFLDEMADNREESVMLYYFPHDDKVMVEFKKLLDSSEAVAPGRGKWERRKLLWSPYGPLLSKAVSSLPRWLGRDSLQLGLDGFARWAFNLHGKSMPTDQIVRYAERTPGKYTFSMWGFPQSRFPELLREYYAFAKDYHQKTGYRPDLPAVGYRMPADDKALFSYGPDAPTLSIDPVSTARKGWDDFLRAYNQWCFERGGKPLFNQTKWLTKQQVQGAFGDRIPQFNRVRAQLDPDDRMFTPYFRALLGTNTR